MAAIEKTQFSMVEFNAFKKGMEEMGVSFRPTTPREKYMAQFATMLANVKPEAMAAKYGGLDNVQRVRVIEDQAATRFDFSLKLPLHILEQRRREADRLKRQRDVVAKAKELASDPKKLDEFITRVAIAILGRTAAELLRAGKAQKSPKAARAKTAPKKPTRKPLSKDDAFERAKRQDRHNRIEASKVAAQKFHEEHDKNKAAAEEAR